MVHELLVLGGVENLKQRGRRVALEALAHLVHLVQEEDRVFAPRLAEALDNPAGHGADVGAPVPADIGFVAGAAKGDPHVLAPKRPGDRLGDRGLAHPRRADEEEDRPLVDLLLGDLAAAGPLGL